MGRVGVCNGKGVLEATNVSDGETVWEGVDLAEKVSTGVSSIDSFISWQDCKSKIKPAKRVITKLWVKDLIVNREKIFINTIHLLNGQFSIE